MSSSSNNKKEISIAESNKENKTVDTVTISREEYEILVANNNISLSTVLNDLEGADKLLGEALLHAVNVFTHRENIKQRLKRNNETTE